MNICYQIRLLMLQKLHIKMFSNSKLKLSQLLDKKINKHLQYFKIINNKIIKLKEYKQLNLTINIL